MEEYLDLGLRLEGPRSTSRLRDSLRPRRTRIS
jgi:hypothetical protein